jgi:hypothetical protein
MHTCYTQVFYEYETLLYELLKGPHEAWALGERGDHVLVRGTCGSYARNLSVAAHPRDLAESRGKPPWYM